jgi:hypothetical protein
MRYIQRDYDVITGNRDLEVLHTFGRFPVYMGAVEGSVIDDEFADMTWTISRSSGMVQLNPVLPLEVVYQRSHGSGTIGKLWNEHHKAFASFIQRHEPQEVLEIGGGHGNLFFEYQKIGKNNWTIVEPNPNPNLASKVKVLKCFFSKDIDIPTETDAIVHSHVLEHIYEPREFFENLGLKLGQGKKLFFSVPNMEEMLRRKYLNCLNFEHTMLLSGTYIEHLLREYGFKLIEKQYFYDDHSVFYAAIRTNNSDQIALDDDLYDQNKSLVVEYLTHFNNWVTNINTQIKLSKVPTYIFGAHVFTQYLFAFGLDASCIDGVLDNDPTKQNKRLSGTNLTIYAPEILCRTDNCNVVLSAGVYNNEIMTQINAFGDTKVRFLL